MSAKSRVTVRRTVLGYRRSGPDRAAHHSRGSRRFGPHDFTAACQLRRVTPSVAHLVLRPRLIASRVVRARLDESFERALGTLVREGRNESEAVRTALVEAGERRLQRSGLAQEVERLARDAQDQRERRLVLSDMDELGSDWPE